MRELRAATGWSEVRLTAALRALKCAGRLETVRRYEEILDGRQMPIPAYRLK